MVTFIHILQVHKYIMRTHLIKLKKLFTDYNLIYISIFFKHEKMASMSRMALRSSVELILLPQFPNQPGWRYMPHTHMHLMTAGGSAFWRVVVVLVCQAAPDDQISLCGSRMPGVWPLPPCFTQGKTAVP